MRLTTGTIALLATFACGDENLGDLPGNDGSTSATGGPSATSLEGDPSTSPVAEDSSGDNATEGSSGESTAEAGSATDSGGEETVELDILFVVDNSGTAGPPQARLAAAAESLVQGLRAAATDVSVNVMVTTTDNGNPQCTPFQPRGYQPAHGAPTTTSCSERISDFDPLAGNGSIPEACTNGCSGDIAPPGGMLHFSATDDNVEAGSAEEALACLLPQGVNGCGYEQPLEAMFAALNPTECWNSPGGCGDGSEPFLRDGADLAVVLVTDELDCSLADYAAMDDEAFQNTNPVVGIRQATSAICFNAGVTCDGPDGTGAFSNCEVATGGPMHPVGRYTTLLLDELGTRAGKHITFLPLVGIATSGADDTDYRQWQDGEYPAGDIVPEAFASGVSAADKEFEFGIGPGCTGEAKVGGYIQALPPVRLTAVCDAVEAGGGTCCLSSICGAQYADALQCLVDGAAN